ncbi:hypothetical protein M408DRAFT_104633 [Serendipita vermifera MAFF 305830]|uniref:Uncharacterized protein n=1 Tax=Serendipita vermifera MAFF 305830 TaxID=933852 RepID=A0A0C3A9T4_SERVB|nr:hypothetical protein M408DRAFT_104633 [Serendipita vermifera MAFF 305830]
MRGTIGRGRRASGVVFVLVLRLQRHVYDLRIESFLVLCTPIRWEAGFPLRAWRPLGLMNLTNRRWCSFALFRYVRFLPNTDVSMLLTLPVVAAILFKCKNSRGLDIRLLFKTGAFFLELVTITSLQYLLWLVGLSGLGCLQIFDWGVQPCAAWVRL